MPDSIPILNCDFKSCCDDHDQCYGKCEGRARDPNAPECAYLRCRDDGDLFGSDDCATDVRLVTSLAAADERRRKCDDALYQAIRELNRGKPSCEAFAIVYRSAVKKWGKGAFQGVDPNGKMLKQNKAEYDAAIRTFFLQGTTSQFEALVESADRGQPSVNLSEPIRWDANRGLVNK